MAISLAVGLVSPVLAQSNPAKAQSATPASGPEAAQAFYAQKRLPKGATKIPAEKYQQAMAAMRQMNHYSTARARSYGTHEAMQRLGTPALGVWTPLGPGNIGGRTRAIVINPTTPTTMYAAGVAGGVFGTTDGGANWTPLTDSLANLAVSSLAMDPHNPLVIYAGTGEVFLNSDAVEGNGIFVTRDGGATWAQMPSTTNTATGGAFSYVNKIVVSPNNSLNLYAATSYGIYASIDGGVTWTQQYNANTWFLFGCDDLAIRNDQPTDWLIASCGNLEPGAVFVNTDAAGAGTWNMSLSPPGLSISALVPNAGSPYSTTGRISLAIAPSSQNIVYALATNANGGNNFGQGLYGVYRSTDGGQTWSAQYTNSGTNALSNFLLSNAESVLCNMDTYYGNQGEYDNVIAVDPLDPTAVWVGGVELYRSNDSGQTWGLASYWNQPSYQSNMHSDQHAIVFHPQYDGVTNQTMYVGNDGGVFTTPNARAATSTNVCTPQIQVNWSSLNNGYAVTQFYYGLPYPGGTEYFGGTAGNGTVRGTDAAGPNAWTQIFGGKLVGNGTGIDGGAVAVNPANTQILYAEYDNGGINQSIDGGNTWSIATSGITNATALLIAPLVMDPSNPQNLWTGGNALWRTTNGAAPWTQASTGSVMYGVVSAIAVAPYNSNYVLAGMGNFGAASGSILSSTSALTTNGNTTWASATPQQGYVSSVAWDPNNISNGTNIAYATYSNIYSQHVWKSTDGGATWNSIDGTGSTGVPDIPVHSIVVDPANSQKLYIGTDLGVMVSRDQGNTWDVEVTGFPFTVTESLAVGNVGSTPYIFAFTHGRGAWRVATADVASNRLSVAKAGSGTGTVTSSPGAIACGPTCTGSFPTGSSVTLSAATDTGFTFVGWSGGGCSGTGTCTVTLSADTTVTATFGGNPAPVLNSISPSTAYTGGPSFALTVNGSNFASGPSLVEINGSARATTWMSPTQMSAQILASDIANPGTPSITVVTPAPGGGTSTGRTLTVSNPPVPVLSSISPSQTYAGGPNLTLTANGSGFTSNSVVLFNGSTRATTYISATQIYATILASDIAQAETAFITVLTPGPGGGTSSFQILYILTPPPPTLNSINPTTMAAGSPSFTLTANGSNFFSNTVVRVNQVARATTYVAPTVLTATILASDVAFGGTLNIDTCTPTSTTCLFSGTQHLTVPGPSITTDNNSTSPGSTVTATLNGTPNGASDTVTLALQGSPPTSSVQMVTVSSLSGNPLTWQVTMPSTVGIYEFRYFLANGTQVAVSPGVIDATSFTPNIGALIPMSVAQGSGAQSITVSGSSFASGITATVGGATRAVSYGGQSQVLVSLLASDTSAQGSLPVIVTNPAPCRQGSCSSNTFYLTVTGPPVPALTSINPSSVNSGSAGFTLTAYGYNFSTNSVVQVNGVARITTFVSATQLTAAILASDIVNAGTPTITVFTPAPGGGTSGGQTLSVLAPPAPVLTSIAPTTASAGGPNFTLTANGSNFGANSVVQFNGSARATTFVSATQLTATITAADIANAGTPTITVFTPTPGGGTSAGQVLTVTAPPAPVLTSISPTTVAAGGANFTLTANGSSFAANSVVKINGNSRTTVFVSASQLTATILAADIALGGTATVTVFTPTPGGGTSAGQTLTITGPTITLSATTSPPTGPITATLNNTPNGTTDWVALALVGSAPSTFVQWTYVNTLTGNPKVWNLTMPTTLGNYEVRYFLNNGYTEAAVSPTITVANINPTPVISSLAPPSVVAGAAAFSLGVAGTGYVNGATATVGGVSRAVTFVSATSLIIAVQASDVASQGNAGIVVTNPASCTGGICTSNSVNLSITAPPPAPVLSSINPTTAAAGGPNFTLTANGSSFTPNSVVQINGVARATVFVSATQLTATILAADIANAGTPSITVLTPTPGGGTSAGQTLTVTAPPAPVLSSISPTTVAAGGASFTLTANGSSFVANSVVRINGTARATVFVSASQLTATILASDIALGGTPNITVFTPTPGGGTSAGQTLTVSGPNIGVSTTQLPPSGPVTATFNNTPNGANDWVSLAVVGSALSTYVQWTYVNTLTGNPKVWNLTMPTTLGNYEVRYFLNNGYTEAAVSPSITVANINATPVISSLNPASVWPGSSGFSLGVTGTGFVSGATATVGGIARAVTFVSANQVNIAVQAGDIASQGNVAIVVTNPTPCTAGNCVSNSVNLSVTVPVPVLNSITPNSLATGSSTSILANGSNFAANSVGQVNGSARPTTFISSTQISITVFSADVASPGTLAITVFTPAPGGGTSAAQTLTVTSPAPAPVLTSIAPSTATSGGPNFTITANGSSFTASSVVQINGVTRATTFVSATQLTATILASDIANAGTPTIAVYTPTPGGGTSAGQTLTVTAPPAPVLTSISPTTVAAGGASFTLTANGSNFTSNSVVRINGTARVTTFVSATQLTAAILAADIALGGTPTITVFTPAPGGGTSAGQTLTVSGPNIGVSATSAPPSGPITATFNNTPNGSTDWVALALVGSAPATFVQWTYVNTLTGNPKIWNLTMPTTLGNYEVRYFLNNGYTEAAVSPSITVANINPTPTIAALIPANVVAGAAAFPLTVSGTGYVNGATATVAGISRAVTFVSATQLSVAVQASDVANQGNAAIVVTNPAACTAGICTSNSVNLSITAPPPAPVLTSIAPTTANAGGPNFTLTANGSNFTPNSVVQINGVARATVFVSATQITATILASDIANAGTPTITVFTPTPGGGTSAGQTLTVTAPPAPVLTSISPTTVAAGGASFTLTANGSSFTANSVVRFNGTARTTVFVSATQLTATILAADIALGGTPTITVFTPAPGGGTSAGQTLTVSGPNIGVSATSAPPSGPITATFNNTPNGSTDWVALALVGAAPSVYVQWTYVSALSGNPKTWNLTMPTTLGNYEVRYFLNNGYTEAAVSPSITVANINPTPVISSLTPPSVVAGAASFSLGVTGTGYVSGATATVGGVARAVTFVSATSLNIAVQASDIASQGNAAIVVTNPGSCTGGICTSNSVNLSITAPPPPPTILALGWLPGNNYVGGPSFTLTVDGSNYVPTSVVQVNGVSRPTTYVTPTQLTLTILASDIATVGTLNITVFTPPPGGGTSAIVPFSIIAPPAPVLTSINPNTANAGGPSFTLTAIGSNFATNSVVQINGTARATTFVNGQQLNVTILAADIANAGTPSITVYTPAPGGGTSAGQPLTVTAPPAPVLTSISPTTVAAGGSSFTLTANGSSFAANSVVRINGTARTTVFVSATQLTATILAADIVLGGTPTITVFTPAPGGGTSAGQTLTVSGPSIGVSATSAPPSGPITATFNNTPNGSTDWVALALVGSAPSVYVQWTYVNTLTGNPKVWNLTMPTTLGNYEVRYFLNNGYTEAAVSPSITVANLNATPVISSLNPPGVVPGSASFSLGVTGTGFVNGATATVAGTPRAVTFVSATSLNIAVQASDVASVGTAAIVVTNPTPCAAGNCVSNSVNLTIATGSPVPTIVATSAPPGLNYVNGPSFTLSVGGTNFVPTSVVQVNGSARATTYVSGTTLTAIVLASDMTSVGTLNISVYTPPPGGGTSGTTGFLVIAPPAPTLTSISPTTVAGGSGAFTLTANGNNFAATSVIQINGVARATTYVNWVQISATISAADIASAGTPSITVFTPTPGGGTSSPQTLTVTPPVGPTINISTASPVSGGAETATLISTPNGSTDWVALAVVGASATSYLQWSYVSALAGNPKTWNITMPTASGQYEIRYFLNNGYTEAAVSPTITIP